MLKKAFIVLMILLPSALYLYIVSKDAEQSKNSTNPPTTTSAPQPQKYQTPDH